GLFAENPASVMNVFYVLTFPLTAVTACLVLRRLPVSRGIALVLALPSALPPAASLMIAVFRAPRMFGRWRPTLTTAALCVVVAAASGSFYYSAFTVLRSVVAARLSFVSARE